MKALKVLGLVIIALAAIGVWIAFNRTFDAASIAQNDISASGNADQGSSVEQVIQKVIPKGPQAPEIASNTWLNSPPLNTSDLRDHVVVVEFWTYG